MYKIPFVFIVVHVWMSCSIASQTNSTDIQLEHSTTTRNIYTFSHPGKSYLEYRHEWPHSRGLWVGVKLGFRTTKSNAFLFHLTYLNSMLLLTEVKPQLFVRIKKGSLHVTYMDDAPLENISIGLGHDQWHTISIDLDISRNKLRVELEPHEQKVFQLKNRNISVLPGQRLTSIVSVGGYSPDTKQWHRGHFVGCIRNVQLSDGRRPTDLLPFAMGDVDKGCHSQCETKNPCQNGGRCINHYVGVTCDCYGTDSAGKLCERSLSAITLQGSEWLIYNLYDDEVDGSRTQWKRLSIEFKTPSSEGILFYARELYPLYSHLAVSLHNSTLHVSVIFVDQMSYSELFVSMGSRLDDDQWHRLTVVHKGKVVEVTVDWMVERMTSDRPDPRLEMPPSVYFGGMDISASILGLRSQNNFVGCLRGLYFNHENVLDALNSSHVKYHNDGPGLYGGCHDLAESAIQFTHDGAFAKMEHPLTNSLRIQMEFRTLKSNSVLAYTESSADTQKGFIQISLIDGQLVVNMKSSLGTVTVTMGNQLHDNRWHNVTVFYSKGNVELEVDKFEKMTRVGGEMSLGDSTYFGFGPSSEMNAAFIGCMKNIRVQDIELDPVKVIHSQLGVGVTLGECDLIDWCSTNETLCQNGGQCFNSWARPMCDCSSIGHFEGTYCQSYIDFKTVTYEDSASFISFHMTMQQVVMMNNISISLRTIHKNRMLLLLMQDDKNASLTMEIVEYNCLLLNYSSHDRNTYINVTIPGLTSGLWQNITIHQKDNMIQRITVNDEITGHVIMETQMKEQSSNHQPTDQISNGTEWQVYVGGIPKYIFHKPHFGFIGCVSDLRLGDYEFDLAKMIQGLSGVKSGCTERCLEDGCYNGGICMTSDDIKSSIVTKEDNNDHWCDCSLTEWAGPKCDEKLEVLFDGLSVIVNDLKIKENDDDDQMITDDDQDIAVYLTYSMLRVNSKSFQALASAYSNHCYDSVVVYITPAGSVSVVWNIDSYRVTLEDKHSGTDGLPHRISTRLNRNKITLKVDYYATHVINLNVTLVMCPLEAFVVGGLLTNMSELHVFNNFTGSISNAFLKSNHLDATNSRPIDVFYGFQDKNNGITVAGKVRPIHNGFLRKENLVIRKGLSREKVWQPYKNFLRNGPSASKSRMVMDDDDDDDDEDEDDKDDDAEMRQKRTSHLLGLFITVALVSSAVAILIGIGACKYRWQRKQEQNHIPSGENPADEEEGLLNESVGCLDSPHISHRPANAISSSTSSSLSSTVKAKTSVKYYAAAFRKFGEIEGDDEDAPMIGGLETSVDSCSSVSDGRTIHGLNKLDCLTEVKSQVLDSSSNQEVELYLNESERRTRTRRSKIVFPSTSSTGLQDESINELKEVEEMETEWDPKSDNGTTISLVKECDKEMLERQEKMNQEMLIV